MFNVRHKIVRNVLCLTALLATISCFKANNESDPKNAITAIREQSSWPSWMPFVDHKPVRTIMWSFTDFYDVPLGHGKNEKHGIQCWYTKDLPNQLWEPSPKDIGKNFCSAETKILSPRKLDVNDVIIHMSAVKNFRTIANWLATALAAGLAGSGCFAATASMPTTLGSTSLLAAGICGLIPSIVGGSGVLAQWDPSWGARPVSEMVRMNDFVKNDPTALQRLNDKAIGVLYSEIPKIESHLGECNVALNTKFCSSKK